MIKHFNLRSLLTIVLCLVGLVSQTQAQSVFYEGFENTTENSFPPSGWTVEMHNPDSVYYHWKAFVDDKASLRGGVSAYIDTKVYQTSQDYPEKPKHELLITPSIELPSDKSCQLSFMWQAHAVNSIEKKQYNTWLLVTTNEGATYDTLWSLTDEKAMVNSGVQFPWTNFIAYRSTIDLTPYKGKQIKIAWYYHNFEKGKGDMFKLDEIDIVRYTPITTPIPQINLSSFTFSESYMNVTVASGDVITLTNVGIDTLRVTSITGLENTDFECKLDASKVALTKNASVKFGFYYTPTLAGAKTATCTVKTNGGDVKITLTGNKISLPNGYNFESFEQDGYPPVGWESKGWTKSNMAAKSGYYGIGVSGVLDKAVITTPRIDLSKTAPSGNHYISFDYIDYADDEMYGTAHDNDDYVELSIDGGKTWSKIWTSEVTDDPNWRNAKITLQGSSNNAYVRIVYDMAGVSFEDLLISTFMVDNIVTPPFYGADQVPGIATNPSPADKAQNQYASNLKLSWTPVIHASGYKVKVGTSVNTLTDVYNQTVTNSHVNISGLQYGKTYYWQVIPTNSVGDAKDAVTWSFSTMADPTIKTLPYYTGFEEETFPPNGWMISGNNEYNKYWSRTDVSPYDGKHSAYSMTFEGTSILSTPPVVLPASPVQQISFMWGNNAPVGLTKNDNPPALPTKLINVDTLYFEISTDDINWKVMGFVSEPSSEIAYWRRAKFDLGEYAGKTVYMRWRYSNVNYGKSKGGALDNVRIEEYNSNGKVMYNYNSWEAGVVNAKTSVSSKDLYMTNDGAVKLVLKKLSFANSNFSSNLVAGLSIEPDETKPFTVIFNAITPGVVKDSMVLEFENGLISKFPVSGNALNENTRCYTFDHEAAFRTDRVDHFSVVDVDGAATISPIMIDYPNIGKPFAFMVLNVKTADWRNVYPVSGEQCLYVSAPDAEGKTAEDWIISESVTATSTSKFRFYGKSYGNTDQFSLHKVSVLVSTKTNAMSDFEVLSGYDKIDLPHSTNQDFTEFNVDLSTFAGKTIYVAVRHNTESNGFVAFFDDFWFENFSFSAIDNQVPYFVTNPVTSAKVGKNYEYSFKAVDPDGDNVSYSIKGLPGWLSESYDQGAGVVKGIPNEAGQVYFVITASDGVLSNTQEVLINVTKDSVSNETDLNNLDLRIYPNPSNGLLNVVTSAKDYKISIINSNGIEVYSGRNENELFLNHISKGMYLLRIEDSSNKIAVKRFIKR